MGTVIASGGSGSGFGSSGIGGLGSSFGILLGLVGVVVVLNIIGVFIIVIAVNRAEPDPSGRRPLSVNLWPDHRPWVTRFRTPSVGR